MNAGMDRIDESLTCPKPDLYLLYLYLLVEQQQDPEEETKRKTPIKDANRQLSGVRELTSFVVWRVDKFLALGLLIRMPVAAMATLITPLLLFTLLLKVGYSSGWGIDGISPADGDLYSDTGGTIGFSTLGRLHFDFDVYTLNLPLDVLDGYLSLHRELHAYEESCVTYGDSVSYNAQLVEADATSAIVERLQANGHEIEAGDRQNGVEVVVYVSEVEGSPQIYIDIPLGANQQGREGRSATMLRFRDAYLFLCTQSGARGGVVLTCMLAPVSLFFLRLRSCHLAKSSSSE